MLSGFNSNSNNIEEIAMHAFQFQTMKGQQFVKKDVQDAYVAFEAFEKQPNDISALKTFCNTAKVCVTNQRTGFQRIVEVLEKKINNLSATPTTSTSATKEAPRK